MKLKGNHSQQAGTEIVAYGLGYNLPKSYIMYSNFLPNWVLSLISETAGSSNA